MARTKRVEDLKTGDRIKFGIARTVLINAVDVAPECVTVHILKHGPNTPTAWSAGRTHAMKRKPGTHVIMAD